ncbi:hypothetical protein Esti_001994 [Eimeria stiedai]
MWRDAVGVRPPRPAGTAHQTALTPEPAGAPITFGLTGEGERARRAYAHLMVVTMQIACVCGAVAALSFSGAAAQSFALSGEGAPLGSPLGALPAGLELDPFLETDEGELAGLNAPLPNEEDWAGEAQQTFLEAPPFLSATAEEQQQHQQGTVLRRRRETTVGVLQPDFEGLPSEQQQQQQQQDQEQDQQQQEQDQQQQEQDQQQQEQDQQQQEQDQQQKEQGAPLPAASALQLQEGKGLLSGIGSALLGSAAGTLLGGAKQTLQGPFALNTPQTNLTANLGSPAAATATPAGTAAAATPMASLPLGAESPAGATSTDASHHVTGIVIGVIVGLLVLCLVGGCVWRMTKRKRRR